MKKYYLLVLILFLFLPTFKAEAVNIAEKMAGRIVLAVEAHGEAWYISPKNLRRYFLGRPADAFNIMREQSQGISNDNLNKIPLRNINGKNDEPANQIDSNDMVLAKKLAGWILLAVEAQGEAWYVNPGDYHRYYLGRPADAFVLMQRLGVGITNIDLATIFAMTPDYQLNKIENEIFQLINKSRTENSLNNLIWNNDLARVAREHSENLARENQAFTGLGVTCTFPMIHHEGLDFGLYHNDRLNNRGVYYFSRSAENIALMPAASLKYSFWEGDQTFQAVTNCQSKLNQWTKDLEEKLDGTENQTIKIEIIKEEITKRTAAWQKTKSLKVVEINWPGAERIASNTVQGWLSSPKHKENIIQPEFDESGIGIAYVNGYIIATQIFIKRADCGFKGGACCTQAGYLPYCFEPYTCQNDLCYN